MSESNKTYTYRGGQKVELEKSPDQMVVRALPENLDDAAIVSSTRVSSAPIRIKTSKAELESMMERNRAITFPSIVATYSRKFGNNIAGQASTKD